MSDSLSFDGQTGPTRSWLDRLPHPFDELGIPVSDAAIAGAEHDALEPRPTVPPSQEAARPLRTALRRTQCTQAPPSRPRRQSSLQASAVDVR